MSDNLIITIGRECGSGGRHIGQALAEKLGVKCYDKELLNLAAKESGLCKELFGDPRREADEQFLIFPGNGYIFPWIYELCIYGYADQPQDLPCAV